MKKKRVIKPRFYVICTLLIAIITSLIIFNLANAFGTEEVYNDMIMFDSSQPIEDISHERLYEEEIIPYKISEVELPVLYEEEIELRYGFTDEDIYILAQVLSGDKSVDGDGEYDIDYQKEINYYEVGKVLGVIMNRVRSKDFPNTVTDVILQKGQFSVIPRNLTKEPSDITLQTVREWCTAYDNYINLVQVVPTNHLFFTGDGKINITRAKYK